MVSRAFEETKVRIATISYLFQYVQKRNMRTALEDYIQGDSIGEGTYGMVYRARSRLESAMSFAICFIISVQRIRSSMLSRS